MEESKEDESGYTFGGFKLSTRSDFAECKYSESIYNKVVNSFESASADAMTAHRKFSDFVKDTAAGELRNIHIVAHAILRTVPSSITGDPHKVILSESVTVASRMPGSRSRALPLVFRLRWISNPISKSVHSFELSVQSGASWKCGETVQHAAWYSQTFGNTTSGRRDFVRRLMQLNAELSHPKIDILMAHHQHNGPDNALTFYREAGKERLWTKRADEIVVSYQPAITRFESKLVPLVFDMSEFLDSAQMIGINKRAKQIMPNLEDVNIYQEPNGRIRIEVERGWASSWDETWKDDSLDVHVSFVSWPNVKVTLADVQLRIVRKKTTLRRPLMVRELHGFGDASKIGLGHAKFVPRLYEAALQAVAHYPTPAEPRGLTPGNFASEVIVYVRPGTSLFQRRPHSDKCPHVHAFIRGARGSGAQREVLLEDSGMMTEFLPIAPIDEEEAKTNTRVLGWYPVYNNKDLIFMHEESRVLKEFGQNAIAKILPDLNIDMEKEATGEPSIPLTTDWSSKPCHAATSLPASLKNLAVNTEERTGSVPRVAERVSSSTQPAVRQKTEETLEEKLNICCHATHTPEGIPIDLTIPSPVTQCYKEDFTDRLWGSSRHAIEQTTSYGRMVLATKYQKEFEGLFSSEHGRSKYREGLAQMGVLYIIAKTGFDGESVWGDVATGQHQNGTAEFRHDVIDRALIAAFPGQQILTRQDRRNKLKWKSNGKTLKEVLKEWCSAVSE